MSPSKGTHRFHGPDNETSVWRIDKPHASELHPTMKPVALYTRALNNSTRRGGIVLDPFAGSGTAAIAAEMTGRRARLVEIDPHYCDVICRRWQDMTGQEPTKA